MASRSVKAEDRAIHGPMDPDPAGQFVGTYDDGAGLRVHVLVAADPECFDADAPDPVYGIQPQRTAFRRRVERAVARAAGRAAAATVSNFNERTPS